MGGIAKKLITIKKNATLKKSQQKSQYNHIF